MDFQPLASPSSPDVHHHYLNIPSPIITRRTRSNSTCQRALLNPMETGVVEYFSRSKGHGFIKSDRTDEQLFVHVSDIEGEYVPMPGDEVKFRLCPLPPKMEKNQAVHVQIINFTPERHTRWGPYDP